MKSIRDIENMSLEQLEAVSMDESIAVPDGFTARMKENVDAAVTVGLLTENESGERNRRTIVRYAAVAASVAVMVGAGYGIAQWQNQPKDTFDDPYLAYAEVEKALARMSDTINAGLAIAEDSEETVDRIMSVLTDR